MFTTGGIGPTHDDITAECIAKAFGVELRQHPTARDLIAKLCDRNGVELNSARLRMANIPVGATLIDNSVSGAPGFKMENVFVLAGVPQIMRDMFQGCRQNLVGGAVIKSRTVTAYVMERYSRRAVAGTTGNSFFRLKSVAIPSTKKASLAQTWCYEVPTRHY